MCRLFGIAYIITNRSCSSALLPPPTILRLNLWIVAAADVTATMSNDCCSSTQRYHRNTQYIAVCFILDSHQAQKHPTRAIQYLHVRAKFCLWYALSETAAIHFCRRLVSANAFRKPLLYIVVELQIYVVLGGWVWSAYILGWMDCVS